MLSGTAPFLIIFSVLVSCKSIAAEQEVLSVRETERREREDKSRDEIRAFMVDVYGTLDELLAKVVQERFPSTPSMEDRFVFISDYLYTLMVLYIQGHRTNRGPLDQLMPAVIAHQGLHDVDETTKARWIIEGIVSYPSVKIAENPAEALEWEKINERLRRQKAVEERQDVEERQTME